VNSTLADLAESYPAEAFFAARSCPICTGSSRIAHAAFNIHPEKTYRFDFRICTECEHGWIDPMPSQGLLNHLYSRGSHSVIGAEWSESAEPVEPTLSAPGRLVCAKELNSESIPRRYFELGVGQGQLYRQFIQNGWECRGVEPGAWGRELPGVYGDFGALPNSFTAEVIVALDVLEHISDPIAALRQLRQIAGSDARLYAAVPNRVSLRAIIGRQHWRMLRPLGHVNYWSRRSVMKAFAESGFHIEELRKTDLWESRPIRTLRSAAKAAIEYSGFGDQWMVIARASGPCRLSPPPQAAV
jgi:SAM-dependent methyltransferase